MQIKINDATSHPLLVNVGHLYGQLMLKVVIDLSLPLTHQPRCDALKGLTRLSFLRKLSIEGGLYHTPHMSKAVASWSAFTNFQKLTLELTPLLNPKDDIVDLL